MLEVVTCLLGTYLAAGTIVALWAIRPPWSDEDLAYVKERGWASMFGTWCGIVILWPLVIDTEENE